MLAFLGAALAPPVLAILGIYLLFLGGLAAVVLLQSTPLGMIGGLVGFHTILFGTFWCIRSFRRWLAARRLVLPLQSSLDPKLARNAGAKGENLLRMGNLGVRLPRGVFLPFDTVERIRREGPSGQTLRRVCENLVKSFGKLEVETLVVRSSFAMEDGERLFPGVFDSKRDVPADQPEMLRNAISSVLESFDAGRVHRYRERVEVVKESPGGAVLIQEQIPHRWHGTAASCHPVEKRPDRIRIELDRPGENVQGVDFSRLSRQVVHLETMPEDITESLLETIAETVERCERLLQGPVIIEFGIVDEGPVFYQLRSQPAQPREVWASSGPISLNPEILPPLAMDLCYGKDFAFLRAHLCRSFGWDERRVNLRLDTRRGRVVFCLTDYLQTSWNPPRRPILRLGNGWLAYDLPPGFKATRSIVRLRKPLIRQAKLKSLAAWLSFAGKWLAGLEKRATFDPLVPWHRFASRCFGRFSKRCFEKVDRLHISLEKELEQILRSLDANEENGRVFMTLEEIAENKTIDEQEIARRKEIFVQDRDAGAVEVWPPWPVSKENQGDAFVVLHAGCVTGKGYHPLSGEDFPEGAPCILLLPDASLRWRDVLPQSVGVVLAGGGMLSHLALQIEEMRIPALVGASAESLMLYHGQELELDTEHRKLRVLV